MAFPRRRYAFLCLCVFFAPPRADNGPDLWPPGQGAEPTYAGRGLREWIARLDDPEPYRRCGAARALGSIGPEALPAFLGLTRALDDPNSEVRVQAAMALGKIGPAASAAAPAMVKALSRASYFDSGMLGPAIAGLGPGAVPALIEATSRRGAHARWEAIKALRLIGPDARDALDTLETIAHEPDGSDRVEAAYALWTIARRPAAVSALIRALDDPDEITRCTATDHLGEIGAGAAPAVPALIRVLDDELFTFPGSAATALGKIGAVAKDAVPALLHAREDSGPQATFAIPIAAIGPDAVPALIVGLDDPADGPRWTAAAALGRIGPAAHDAAPKLARMMDSDRPHDRVVAATALWQIARDARVVSILAEATRPANGNALRDRYDALEALRVIGPAAAEAVPVLNAQLALKNDIGTYLVVEVLGEIGPGAGANIAAIERISAQPDDESLRTKADLALWRITRGAKGLDALIGEVQRGNHLAQVGALSAIRAIGRDAAPAVPAITDLLRDRRGDLFSIATTLGAIGPPARSALPHLIAIFNDERLLYKDDLAEAIRAIDPATAKALGIR